MSEDRTRDLLDSRSFEERVFARFDSMDVRFNSIDVRFETLETRFDARFDAIDARFEGVDARLDRVDSRVQALEAKALDTKPIWERALAEILEVKNGVEDIQRKFEILTLDVMHVRGDQRRVEERMKSIESRIR